MPFSDTTSGAPIGCKRRREDDDEPWNEEEEVNEMLTELETKGVEELTRNGEGEVQDRLKERRDCPGCRRGQRHGWFELRMLKTMQSARAADMMSYRLRRLGKDGVAVEFTDFMWITDPDHRPACYLGTGCPLSADAFNEAVSWEGGNEGAGEKVKALTQESLEETIVISDEEDEESEEEEDEEDEEGEM